MWIEPHRCCDFELIEIKNSESARKSGYNRASLVDAASARFSVACATRDLAPRVVSLLSNGENAAGH
jgi:hypothetical protein